ncbi:MAG: enoyl-CoA hydratase/isomerase family protein [Candidatus Tectomicrobia bacterium]|uniref:Enoyl-CoA hydratase/isomerase family protein n=1 Tax=Tectimicrobiota bacterium TaxID=2528274 RepID=A0A932G029_UNCTE|nr:enoyl-CoA hydratase/isomerase family protein [Candidatus Tectomicrobia bacterium]
MELKNLKLEVEDGIAVVTVNRPESLNPLNRETMGEIQQVAQALEEDGSVKAVIFTGAGDKSFVAGADIKDVKDLTALGGLDLVTMGHRTFEQLNRMTKPVIAAVNGYCFGGGLELAMGCDFIIASERASFGVPEAKIGVFAGWGGVQRLARRVGTAWAIQMNMTGDPIDAQTALRINLANLVVPHDQLLAETKKIARRIMANAPVAIRLIKSLVYAGEGMPVANALVMDVHAAGVAFSTADQREGMNAFVEKRKPNFQGK